MKYLGKVRADKYHEFLKLINKFDLRNQLERESFSFGWNEERRVMYVYYKGYWEAEIQLPDWALITDL